MRRAVILVALLVPTWAHAHEGGAHGYPWTFAPWVTVPLALSGLLYLVGVKRLWARAGQGRGVRNWQVLCFALGWTSLLGALVSPLHALGERLFTAHMTEHEILMVVGAPLLVVARPIGGMLWALPPEMRRTLGGIGRVPVLERLWAWLVDPLTATTLHGIALWVWHLPALYEPALTNSLVHWLQHLSFFVTALFFWWSLLRGRARQRGYGAAVFYLFVTALHSGFLGILLAVARAPLFPNQTSVATEWGLTPLEDQQLAGLIMWVPAGIVYAGAALALAALWIQHSGSLAPRGGVDALAPR
jgi:putative membrane protein